MSFVHLHVHSSYSPLDGFTSVEEYFQRAEDLKMPGLAITDHGVISAIPDIIESAKKHPSVKPIIGVEAYITDHYSHKDKSSKTNKCFHIILLAKNEIGFKNLCALCQIAKTEGMRINRPRISHELLEKYHEGLICTSACIGGEIPQAYLNKQLGKAREITHWFKNLFGEDFYLEVSSHYSELPESKNELFTNQQYVNAMLFKGASDLDIKVIASNDVHFLKREDGPSQDALMCEKMHVLIDNQGRIRFTQQEFFKTEEEMRSLFKNNEEVINNTIEILNKIESYDLDEFLDYYKTSEDAINVAMQIQTNDQHSKTIMGKLDKIVSTLISEDTDGNTHFEEFRIPEVKEELKFIANKFHISETQAMLFALMFEGAGYEYCSMKHFADYLGVTSMRAFSYNEDYEVLRKKWLIRMNPEGRFRIPRMVINASIRNEAFEKPDFKNLDSAALILQIEDFINYVNHSEYSIEEAVEDSQLALSENPNSGISKVYVEYDIIHCSTNEKFLFFLLVNERLNEGRDSLAVFSLRSKFKDNDFCIIRNRIHGECLRLQKKKVVVFETSDGMVTKDHIKISEDVLSEICKDAPVLLESDSPAAGVIKPGDIAKKELFFSSDVQRNISTLSELLEDTKYIELKRNLKRSGMREGFTCLFYGSPGTGKTESVYQLAKESGRELLEVDVATLMNCFVGETEKNTRRVFENYRRAARGNKKAPILLFNEADAILGKRMKGAERAVDRMGNSVQNIILQEMEKLDGIMIATTNLTENLDPAFERRFLYKIKFENPTTELRSKIWAEMIPDLKEEEVNTLASAYNFSGGQIENIARKRSITQILSGKEVSFDQVRCFCGEEMLQSKENTRIGF